MSFEGKGLTREFIVIHMPAHLSVTPLIREPIVKKPVRGLTWKASVIKSARSIEIVDRYGLTADVGFTINSY